MFRSPRILSFTAAFVAGLTATSTLAHTNSIGYENAGPGAVTFWYGNWHANTSFTEGSLRVQGNSYDVTTTFNLLTTTKPSGLIDGTTNFFSNGTQLVGTPSGGTYSWQGATFSGLTAGTYTFTYLPIVNPTQEWEPADNIILSSSVTLDASVIGSSFQDNASGTNNPMTEMLDGIYGSAPTDMQNALDDLKNLSDDEQREALKKIAPETSTAATQAATQTVSGVLDTVSTRMEGLRAGDTTTLADQLNNGTPVQVADNGDMARLFSLGQTGNSAIWSKVFGGLGRQDAKDGFAGYRSTTAGVSVGADTRTENKWIIGAAATYAATGVKMHDFRDGDRTDIDSYQVTGYATRDFGPWYLETSGAYARQDYNSTRDTGFGIANGEYSGNQFVGRATVGVPIEIGGNWTVTPLAGAEVTYLTQEAYTETGAGVFSASYDDNDATRVRSLIGPRFGTKVEVGGYDVRPSVHALWWHDFRNDGIDSTASFSGGGSSFTTAGQELNSDTFNLGTAVSISESKDFRLTVQADSELADGYQNYSGQLMGRWSF